MLPEPTLPNRADRAISNAVLLGHPEAAAVSGSAANVEDRISGQSRHAMLATVLCVAALLTSHIGHVVAMSSKEEMVRVEARRIIAAVEDEKAGWNFSAMKFPRYAVNLTPDIIESDTAVTLGCFAAAEIPTSRDGVDAARSVKTFDDRLVNTHWHLQCALARGRGDVCASSGSVYSNPRMGA